MRYSKEHKETTRRKLMDSSRALAKAGGFDSTGIDALMSAIGMTAGAFYTHFPSKQALFQALVDEEMEKSHQMLSGGSESSSQDADDQSMKALRAYLSMSHAEHPEFGCVLPTLGGEIARSGPEIRAIVEKWLNQTQQSWSAKLDDPDAAWSIMAQCVGALVLSRAVESRKTRSNIIESNRRYIRKALNCPG